MPDKKPEDSDERVVVDARTLTSLDPQTLARLRSEFGATLELRASKPGLAALLDNLSKAGNVGAIADVAAYDRGFDRTNPGYDKYYDRDRAMLETLGQDVVNPGIDISALNKLSRR